MAPYDSDSSADENENDNFTETNVLLGYASKDPGDETISRLGGHPEWLDPSNPPSAALARCKVCKDLMVLLLQLNGELPDRFPGHERRLYVFACRRKTCRRKEGSIRALRSVRISLGATAVTENKKKEQQEEVKPKEEIPKPPSNLGETLFGAKTIGSPLGSANPFSTTNIAASTSSNPFSSPGNPFSSPSSAAAPQAESSPKPKNGSPTPPATATSTEEDLKSLPKTFAQTLSLNNTQPQTPPTAPEPWPPVSSQPPAYPISYLADAEFETLDPTPTTIPQSTRMDVDPSEDPNTKTVGKNGKEDRDVFESSMDAAFQRFADRLSQNPEQAIRYEFSGQPLLYSKTDSVGRLFSPSPSPGIDSKISTATTTANGNGNSNRIPRCPNCGSPRTFEVQLTPHAITELEAEELSLEGMDWGTVIVGVCERDCQARHVVALSSSEEEKEKEGEGRVGYLEEWAGVQWEELTGSSGAGRR